jgi:hypothetical protein
MKLSLVASNVCLMLWAMFASWVEELPGKASVELYGEVCLISLFWIKGFEFCSTPVDALLPDCANPAAPAIAVPANPIADDHFTESPWLEGAIKTVTPMIPPMVAIKIGVKELINSGVMDFMVGNPYG